MKKEFIHNFRTTINYKIYFNEILNEENIKLLKKISGKNNLVTRELWFEKRVPYKKDVFEFKLEFRRGRIKLKVIYKNKVIFRHCFYSNKAFNNFLKNFKSYLHMLKRKITENKNYHYYIMDGKIYKSTKSLAELRKEYRNIKKLKLKNLPKI